jgi:hypothetical protein
MIIVMIFPTFQLHIFTKFHFTILFWGFFNDGKWTDLRVSYLLTTHIHRILGYMDGCISSSSSCPLDPLSHGIQAWSGIGSFLSFWQQRAAKKESPEQICSVQDLHLTIQNCTTSLRLRIFHTQSTQSTQSFPNTRVGEERETSKHFCACSQNWSTPPYPFRNLEAHQMFVLGEFLVSGTIAKKIRENHFALLLGFWCKALSFC